MKPNFKRAVRPANKFYRLNFFIQAKSLRLLDETGKQVGIVTKEEAMQRARALGIDVVEIAPNANPPVAKLIDYKKFKYLEAKKEQEEKKKQKNVGVKELRMRPFIGEHDLQVRVSQAKEFLASGNQVKISIPFRGREITRKEFGFETMKKFLSNLTDMKVVREPHFEGKIMIAMIASDKKTRKNEEKTV